VKRFLPLPGLTVLNKEDSLERMKYLSSMLSLPSHYALWGGAVTAGICAATHPDPKPIIEKIKKNINHKDYNARNGAAFGYALNLNLIFDSESEILEEMQKLIQNPKHEVKEGAAAGIGLLCPNLKNYSEIIKILHEPNDSNRKFLVRQASLAIAIASILHPKANPKEALDYLIDYASNGDPDVRIESFPALALLALKYPQLNEIKEYFIKLEDQKWISLKVAGRDYYTMIQGFESDDEIVDRDIGKVMQVVKFPHLASEIFEDLKKKNFDYLYGKGLLAFALCALNFKDPKKIEEAIKLIKKQEQHPSPEVHDAIEWTLGLIAKGHPKMKKSAPSEKIKYYNEIKPKFPSGSYAPIITKASLINTLDELIDENIGNGMQLLKTVKGLSRLRGAFLLTFLGADISLLMGLTLADCLFKKSNTTIISGLILSRWFYDFLYPKAEPYVKLK